ncbi:hypothetical protein [Variovorax saccharolyticus]|uniref:hypothetical protein n=1 Tax=Variovorax saccharolyticus TaxID=3053516 RepID=UPI0025755478|nr:hypothetical protein [Variovorax sp. J22R187]MDM0019506.1 hypothetical protein [Variovorax sp. J22R187]
MTSQEITQIFRRALMGVAVLASVSGCALVVRGTQQNIQVNAVSTDGKALESADCRPSGGAAPGPAAPQIKVRRSTDDLLIHCVSKGQVVASATVISRADMGLVSLVVGGVISATIDQLSGAAYAYPAWITLVAGEERVYDHRDSGDGPLAGTFARRLGPAGAASVVVLPANDLAKYYRANFNVTASQLVRPGARRTGRDTYGAEKLAATLQCSATPRAVLVEKGAGFEIHQVACATGDDLAIRCEFGLCRVEPALPKAEPTPFPGFPGTALRTGARTTTAG